MILMTEETPSRSVDAVEYTIEADQIRFYFDGNEFPEDFDSVLDQLQGDARIQGKAQYLILTVKP